MCNMYKTYKKQNIKLRPTANGTADHFITKNKIKYK